MPDLLFQLFHFSSFPSILIFQFRLNHLASLETIHRLVAPVLTSGLSLVLNISCCSNLIKSESLILGGTFVIGGSLYL